MQINFTQFVSIFVKRNLLKKINKNKVKHEVKISIFN